MKAVMMRSQANIEKIAFGSKRPIVATFVATISTCLIGVSLSLAADGYNSVTSSRSRITPQVRSYVGTLKGPPSSARDGLVTRPSSEIYNERNLFITGNVASGRQFQGFVPYSSPTDFQGRLGSADLNSFMRRSVRTPYELTSEGRYLPYYLPSKTVTTIKRGDQSGLKAPVILPQGQRPVYEPRTLKELQRPSTVEDTMIDRIRPFSFDSEEIARKLSKKVKNNNLQIVDELLYDQDRAAEVKKILREFEEDRSKQFERELSRQLKIKHPEMKESDIKAFLKENLPGEVEKLDQPKIEKKTFEQETEELTKFIEEDLGITPRKRDDKVPGIEEEDPESAKAEPAELTFEEQLDELVAVDHKQAMELLGEHKDFDSLARAKYETYQKLADEFMKEGKYYDARDTWSFAENWIPDNPDSEMGKGNALFAAGEYISSAYYIEQGLTYSPEYAAKRSNLFQLVDKKTIENQMTELTSIYNGSKSYRLGFILAHLNYQQNKLAKAAEYLVAIKQQMDQSQGYQNLKKAVEAAIAREGDK